MARSRSSGLSHHSAGSVPTTGTPGSADIAPVNAGPIRGVPNVSISDDKKTAYFLGLLHNGFPSPYGRRGDHTWSDRSRPGCPGSARLLLQMGAAGPVQAAAHAPRWAPPVSAHSVSSGRSHRHRASYGHRRRPNTAPPGGDRIRPQSVTQAQATPMCCSRRLRVVDSGR